MSLFHQLERLCSAGIARSNNFRPNFDQFIESDGLAGRDWVLEQKKDPGLFLLRQQTLKLSSENIKLYSPLAESEDSTFTTYVWSITTISGLILRLLMTF